MKAWTAQTWAAIGEADRAHTRAWHKVMRAFSAEADLAAAMAIYNAMMPAATQRWNQEIAAAVALSEGAEF